MPPGSPADTWVVVPLTGEIDLASAPELRAELGRLNETETPAIVLDLTDLEFIDSTGLGVLVGALRRARSQGGDIRLAGARPGIRRVLSVTGLDRVFELFATVAEAMTGSPGAAPAV